MRLILDTGVLGQICHPRKYHDVRSWFRRAVREHELLVSEVAARLWARLRRSGRVTAEGLDGDVLIATHALEEMAGIVTSNEKHFEGIIDVYAWTAVPLPEVT